MGERQPDVERHQTCLRPHPDEGCQRDRDLHPRAGRDRARIADCPLVREQQDRHPRPGTRKMRQRDVEDHRAARGLVRAGDQDHRRRDEGHRLPGDEERQRVACHEDEHLHGDEQRRECPDRASLRGRRQVADRVRQRGGADRAEHAEEQAGEGVDAHAWRERARERLARARVVPERPEPAHCDQQAARSLHGEPDRERAARDREQPPCTDRGDAGHHERGEGHDSASSRSIDC